MTSRASKAADNIPNLPILQEKEQVSTVGILLVTGDRGLAGPFNSQIIRAGNARARELRSEGAEVLWYASGRRGISSLQFRELPSSAAAGRASPTAPPSPTLARSPTGSRPRTSTTRSTASRSSTTATSRR